LSERTDTEILTWLEDCARCALSITARRAVTTPIVLATFRSAVATHAIAALMLTDNGMVFTTGLSGISRTGGRNAFEAELRRLNFTQKSSRSGHPITQGKVERFQQTMKNWLRAANLNRAQSPNCSSCSSSSPITTTTTAPTSCWPTEHLPRRIYQRMPKATPTSTRDTDAHERARQDRVENADSITLRVHGRLHHTSIGGTHARTPVIIHTHDPHIRVLNTTTEKLLREPTTDQTRHHQPPKQKKLPNQYRPKSFLSLARSHGRADRI